MGGVCGGKSSRRGSGIGGNAAIGWCRCTIGVGQSLFPKFGEATGEVLGEVAFRPSSKFLGGLVEVCTKGSEDPEFGVVGGWSCVTVVASAGI